MSYLIQNHKYSSTVASAQNINTTTYTEITGSRGNATRQRPNSKIIYRFSFLASSILENDGGYKQKYMHVKLQKSNDGFSSNIVDVPNCLFNLSSDTRESDDGLSKTCTAFFIIEDFDSTELRLVCRSYSTSYEARLHTSSEFDGLTAQSENYAANLMIIEV